MDAENQEVTRPDVEGLLKSGMELGSDEIVTLARYVQHVEQQLLLACQHLGRVNTRLQELEREKEIPTIYVPK